MGLWLHAYLAGQCGYLHRGGSSQVDCLLCSIVSIEELGCGSDLVVEKRHDCSVLYGRKGDTSILSKLQPRIKTKFAKDDKCEFCFCSYTRDSTTCCTRLSYLLFEIHPGQQKDSNPMQDLQTASGYRHRQKTINSRKHGTVTIVSNTPSMPRNLYLPALKNQLLRLFPAPSLF